MKAKKRESNIRIGEWKVVGVPRLSTRDPRVLGNSVTLWWERTEQRKISAPGCVTVTELRYHEYLGTAHFLGNGTEAAMDFYRELHPLIAIARCVMSAIGRRTEEFEQLKKVRS